MSSILDELKNKYPNTEGVQKANNIAEGVAAMPTGGSGSAVLIINVIEREDGLQWTLDKTWQEIYDAYSAGTTCVILYSNDDPEWPRAEALRPSAVKSGRDQFDVVIANYNMFSTQSASDYPFTRFD